MTWKSSKDEKYYSKYKEGKAKEKALDKVRKLGVYKKHKKSGYLLKGTSSEDIAKKTAQDMSE